MVSVRPGAGAKVCISDINQEVGEKALEELRERFTPDNVCFQVCDVCQAEWSTRGQRVRCFTVSS